jgi:hypothetical protein
MKKFLIGCGVLTGVAALVLAGVAFFAVRWVKNNAPDLERLQHYEAEMVDSYGEPEDFEPPKDGAYDLQRAREYIRVRDSLYDVSSELRQRMQEDAAEGGERKKGVRRLIAGFRSGAAYLRDSFEYLADADSILLEAEMGRGEYVHWTGLLVRGGLGIRGGEFLDFDEDKDDRGAMQSIGIDFEKKCRTVYLDQFENLRREVGSDDPWIRLVEDERARVRRLDGVWPFSDGDLPPPVKVIFDAVESDLRRTAPRDISGLMLDNVLGAKIDDEGGGVQIKFD